MKPVNRKRVCKTWFSWDKGCLLYFFEGKGMLWSPVLGRTRYTPLCPQKTRISIHFFKILCFFGNFSKKYNILGPLTSIFGWTPIGVPLNTILHRFNMVVVRVLTRNTQKSPILGDFQDFRHFWSEMTTCWVTYQPLLRENIFWKPIRVQGPLKHCFTLV